MIQDISKAYVFALASREIYIELPPENAEPGMLGKLEKSLCGARHPHSIGPRRPRLLLAMGFKREDRARAASTGTERDASTVVHDDDFLSAVGDIMEDGVRDLVASSPGSAHMCASAMMSQDEHDPGYAMKPTSFLTQIRMWRPKRSADDARATAGMST